MKIAVAYDNGQIFQHFGRTEFFKVYEVEDKKNISSEVLSAEGSGHSALAEVLAANGVNALICGGIGGCAQEALAEYGISIYAGVHGLADDAVTSLLNGELTPGGANCDHHGAGGGCHSEGGCGGHCGGGCSIEGKNVGKNCKVHYRGTFNDGSQFDSSYDRGEPLSFICGAGMMIRGFDAAVADMDVGQIVNVHLMPEEAYGPRDPRAIFTIEISRLPGSEDLTVGQQVYLSNAAGQPFPVTVAAREGDTITFDANHEMAGKELNFQIELVEVI